MAVDPASFRDSSGHVYVEAERVYRTVLPPAKRDYEFVRSTGLLPRLTDRGLVIGASEIPPDASERFRDACYVLEHPHLPVITYPYEWSFVSLRAAALHTLEIYLEALEAGVTLSDASAFNIQFVGPKPLFIDYLSFREYREGEFWMGHRQFCEHFLNPLLLTSKLGVAHQAWYRGSLEGISSRDLANMLPLVKRLSWNLLTHVTLQAGFSKPGAVGNAAAVSKRKLPLEAYKSMLRSLRKWIAKLEPASSRVSIWEDYARNHSYTGPEETKKRDFVRAFAKEVRPAILWDIGCNTGEYSKVALEGGARQVVGFESDQGALDAAVGRAVSEDLAFLPLYLDAANPTSDAGWAQKERKGLIGRANADAIIALALVHHLAIGRNVPLDRVVDWLVTLAPQGTIEFVPKQDRMVQELLRLREDIFADYTHEGFMESIQRRARVVRSEQITDSGRVLVWYHRT